MPPTFNRLAWSNLAAQSAEQVALAAAPIVAVLLLGAGEGQTGLLQTALTLPFVLFAIPAGLLADRLSRRRLMAGAEALRAGALLAILVAASGSACSPCRCSALLGFVAVCGTVVYSVAAPSLVPSLVSPQALPAANARIELARTVAFASGPALGGVLVGWIGAGPAFGFAAGTVDRRCRAAGAASTSRHGRRSRVAIRCRRSARVRRSSSATLCCGRSSSPSSSSTRRGSSSWRSSCPMPSAISVCRRAASARRWRCTASAWWWARLSATRVMRRLSFGSVIGLGPVTGFVASAIIALTTVFPTPLLAGLGFFLLGAGPILWVISTTTLRQSVTPPRLLGRVSAINIMSYGARPLGAGLGALVGGLFGAEACLYLAVAGFAVQMLVILHVTGGEPGAPARDGLRLTSSAYSGVRQGRWSRMKAPASRKSEFPRQREERQWLDVWHW